MSQKRASESIGSLIKIENGNDFVSANNFHSNAIIADSRSRRSLSVNSAYGSLRDSLRKSPPNKKMSIYHRIY